MVGSTGCNRNNFFPVYAQASADAKASLGRPLFVHRDKAVRTSKEAQGGAS
jgi:hypothetical protein